MIFWENVALDGFSFAKDSRSIQMKLIDLDQGAKIAHLVCQDIFHFSTQNIFQSGDGYAAFIGEVSCDLIQSSEVNTFLLKQQFPFRTPGLGCKFFEGEDLFWLQLDGGEISVAVGCRSVYCSLD